MVTIMTLLDLPPEILQAISSCISYGSQLALKLSCRRPFAIVDDANPHACTDQTTSPNKSYSMADLVEIEQWPEYNAAKFMPAEARQPMGQRDFFACHICLKILSADRFSNAMMKGKRGKLGGTLLERSKRFCIQCEIVHGRYPPGTYLHFGGASGRYGLLCRPCGRFETGQCSEIQIAERRCDVCCGSSYKGSSDAFDIIVDCSDWRDLLGRRDLLRRMPQRCAVRFVKRQNNRNRD